MARQNLVADARRALAWSAIANWLDVGGSALTFLVMVKLLGPETFGVYGMALVALALPQAIVGGALSESIIQRAQVTRGHITATFWMEIALAAALFGVMILLTPYLTGLFGQKQLTVLIPAMAGTLFLLAFGAAPAAILQRDLKFKAIAGVDAVGGITAAVVGLTLAAIGFGLWALMWMEVARRASRALGFAVAARWRPAFSFKLRDARDLTHFNAMTLATRLAQEADGAFPRFMIGVVMGPHALGYYNLASRIFQQGAALIVAPFWALALPIASNARHDRPLLHATLNGATAISSLLAFPVFLGAAAVAPVAIPALLGASWAPAVVMAQITLLNGVQVGAAPLTTGMLRGVGAASLALAIMSAAAMLGGVLTLVAAPWGLAAVAAALLGRNCLAWAARSYALQRAIGYPVSAQFLIGWRSLLAAGVMAGVLLLAQALAPAANFGILAVGGLVCLGATTYAAVLSILSPALARRLLDLVVALARRDRTSLSSLLRMPGSHPDDRAGAAAVEPAQS